jgi:hypothetical protein
MSSHFAVRFGIATLSLSMFAAGCAAPTAEEEVAGSEIGARRTFAVADCATASGHATLTVTTNATKSRITALTAVIDYNAVDIGEGTVGGGSISLSEVAVRQAFRTPGERTGVSYIFELVKGSKGNQIAEGFRSELSLAEVVLVPSDGSLLVYDTTNRRPVSDVKLTQCTITNLPLLTKLMKPAA